MNLKQVFASNFDYYYVRKDKYNSIDTSFKQEITQSLEEITIELFDYNKYLNDYPDVRSVFPIPHKQMGMLNNNKNDPMLLLNHFFVHGRNENRRAYCVRDDNEKVRYHGFDLKGYKQVCEEAYHSLIDNELSGYIHYLNKNPSMKLLRVKSEVQLFNDPLKNQTFVKMLQNEWARFESWEYKKKHGNNLNAKELFIDYLHNQTYIKKLIMPPNKITIKNDIHLNETNFIDEKLSTIYKNIEQFSQFINPYNNILFICSDYPGYGGAATNCSNLSEFYKRVGHNIYSIYWNYAENKNKKLIKTDTYEIIDQVQLQKTLQTLSFKPDVIVLKNAINIDLKKIFQCPIVFLIPGIYKNDLNVHYTEFKTMAQHNKYINQATLYEIRRSDICYCNSLHTQNILQKLYGLKTDLFYSSFIQYYGKVLEEDPAFNNRKYDYGFIVSNFDRKIKNVDKSIEFLKGKKNVVLIGEGSSKYASHGFACIEFVDNDKMPDYYRDIKYIVQDSFYESCSNVTVEGLFNGCKIKQEINPEIILLKRASRYTLAKHKCYIIGNPCEFYNDIILFQLFIVDQYTGYIIDTPGGKIISHFVYCSKDITMNHEELFQKTVIRNNKIGYNADQFANDELIELYYEYGKYNIEKNILGLSLFYDNYLLDKPRKYNKNLFILIHSYHCGTIKKYNYVLYIKNLLKTDIFHTDTVLIISKLIRGYGGVQKTSIQLIQTLETQYNIHLLSNTLINRKIYDYRVNQLNDEIPNCILVTKSNKRDIETFINDNDFAFIINNKLNESLQWNINKKIHYICHNSMDPLNTGLLKNQDKIASVFTINNFHKNLLILNGFCKPINLYNNYVFDNIPPTPSVKKTYKYNIAFIGRISSEKNIQCLIDGVNFYNQHNNRKINLYIIGDGNVQLYNINKYIIQLGRLTYTEIVEFYDKVDYVISSAITEGKPFAIIEALSHGIPCLHSNINGITEIIYDEINGFLFQLEDYDKIKLDMSFDRIYTIHNEHNKCNISNMLCKAYAISIDKWNEMSKNAINTCAHKYVQSFCIEQNMKTFTQRNDQLVVKKELVFINFKPNINIPYGGGNISVFYLIQRICGEYSDFEITYELEENIDLYIIIDPFKDNKFKKYDLLDVIMHRNTYRSTSKIIIRVNDCDKTRSITTIDRSREQQIIKNFKDIDFFIFNSQFIKNYYFLKFKTYNLEITDNYTVITNGCDQKIFQNDDKSIHDKIKIVTHHWSDNMYKGYQTYYDLWKYAQNNKMNIEFVFIGKNVPAMFNEVPINGPFVKEQLSNELNLNNIYITDSKYDSCPNHVLEALSCGLPVLYSNVEGGAKELCKMSPYKIGEMYDSFEDLLQKIQMIKRNYAFYRENINKSLYLYDINYSISKYYNVFIKNINEEKMNVKLLYENNIITITCKTDKSYLLLNDNLCVKLLPGKNIFALNKQTYQNIQIIGKNKCDSIAEFRKYDKLHNNKVNILLCSDANYFVGVFAVLHSVIKNTHFINKSHFNFMIPIEQKNYFSNMLSEFEGKMSIILDKTIIYIDSNILDPILFKTKCYNGGDHLLNIGNFSRLLIGEFMEYDKLIYLDSDSIVQSDIVDKLSCFHLEYDLYAGCANKIHSNHKKQIIIKYDSIITCDYDWKSTIGCDINKDDFAFMGAPFVTNCKKWSGIYKRLIEIINIHNNTENGIYKLFTMSIQNILFYKKTGNINKVLHVIQDLGSIRKEWDNSDLIDKDVLDWSGIYKPWYSNGLYRHIWVYHDIMKLSTKYNEIIPPKEKVDYFNCAK
jgi:glycosyltransferase involved in cell wall biosynthesis